MTPLALFKEPFFFLPACRLFSLSAARFLMLFLCEALPSMSPGLVSHLLPASACYYRTVFFALDFRYEISSYVLLTHFRVGKVFCPGPLAFLIFVMPTEKDPGVCAEAMLCYCAPPLSSKSVLPGTLCPSPVEGRPGTFLILPRLGRT